MHSRHRCFYRRSILGHAVTLALLSFSLPYSQTLLAADDVAPPPAELPEVQVHAGPEGSVQSGYRNTTGAVGPLGQVPLQDIPYSLNVTSGALFENRSAHTVSEALKTNPTVSTLMEPTGYSSLSRVMVRGFTAADQGDLRDGIVDRSFTFVPLENVERIEVLNGFSSFLNGFGALGGSVNYVSKQPTATPTASIATGQYGGGINYLHGDAGGPAGDDGRWGYRANVYDEDGNSYIDGSHQQRSLYSGVLSFKLSPDTVLHADFWHQQVNMQGLQTYIDVNTAKGIGVPDAARFSAKTQYGQDWTYNKSSKSLLGIGMESTLSQTFTLRTGFRYGQMSRDYAYVGGVLTNNNGSYTEKVTGSPVQDEQTRAGFAMLDASFDTGGLVHKATFGYTGAEYMYSRGDDVAATLGTSNIDAPAYFANPNLRLGAVNVWSGQDIRNWVFSDRLQFSDAWSALIGVTRAQLQQIRWGTGSALASPNYSQRQMTPSYALLFKPIPTLTTYVSYMEGLVTGGFAPVTAANANAMLAPSVSNQYEGGIKASVGGMDLTAAVFRIDKINEYTDPADNTYKQDGREIHKGIEFTATGKLYRQLTVIGGLTVMNAQMTQVTNNPSIDGKAPVNVPAKQARLYLEYGLDDLPGLTLVGGANFSGRRAVDAANTAYMAGATTFDAGLRYQTGFGSHRLSLNLNVSNLFDKAYWSYYRSGDGLLLGSPRVISATAKVDF